MYLKTLVAVLLGGVSVLGNWGEVAGQQRQDHSTNTLIVRPRGQPVIPLYEGWMPNPDGTVTLSFAYINLNATESVDIPLGPDNFIEPSNFDGVQPTHFDSAPPANRNYRHLSVFTVRVPGSYTGEVVWTLRSRGRTFSVPGRTSHEGYRINDLESFSPAPVSAEIRVNGGQPGRGRSGVTAGPFRTRVGQPLQLTVAVDPQPASVKGVTGSYQGAQMQPRTMSTVLWFHHRGPGNVTFSNPESLVEGDPGEGTTTATFDAPGDYVLRVWAIENFAAVNTYCCWTTGYVSVTVMPES